MERVCDVAVVGGIEMGNGWRSRSGRRIVLGWQEHGVNCLGLQHVAMMDLGLSRQQRMD